MAAATQYGKGLGGLLKKGWNEIPGVMGSSVLALAGLALGTVGIATYMSKGDFEKKYKFDYIVYRSDDPRAQKVLQERQSHK